MKMGKKPKKTQLIPKGGKKDLQEPGELLLKTSF